jgi:hypothetical protein
MGDTQTWKVKASFFFFFSWLDSASAEASRSHSDTQHSVGLLWTSVQSDVETSIGQHTILTRGILAPDGIRTRSFQASELPQIHALGRTATGIGDD